ncbi:MAG: Rid family detoxifying hydrolase [Anaerohalosphaera sp.]|nr:Rid family detoxifying hydrolase [Anaerohalosphaera sp.]
MREIISTENAPGAIGPYSQAVMAGGVLYISGQLGIDPATGKMTGDTVADQTTRALENIKAILQAAQMDLDDVVQCQVFLADIKDFGEMNAAYAEYFPTDPPTRAAFQAGALPAGGKVEILATAVK